MKWRPKLDRLHRAEKAETAEKLIIAEQREVDGERIGFGGMKLWPAVSKCTDRTSKRENRYRFG